MSYKNRRRGVALVVATAALTIGGAAPAGAEQFAPFKASFAGALQITGAGEAGPTSAFYGGNGVAVQLGATQTSGDITITGPAPNCANGFTATHTDVLTASSGDRVFVNITETSCPRPDDPSTFDCSGTYTVVGGTGRFEPARGNGTWSGSLAFTSPSSGNFKTSYAGTLSVPSS